jgi:hypothetical protein
MSSLVNLNLERENFSAFKSILQLHLVVMTVMPRALSRFDAAISEIAYHQ